MTQTTAPRVNELAERLLDFATGSVKLWARAGRTMPGRYIAGQLLRAASSAGANYEEACGAESRADFTHKLQIALKELREARYWLRLMGRSQLAPDDQLSSLADEAGILARMVGKSVVTAKSRR
ncbi:MAG: four helix bundle protein [candidate division WOR-3 bacterium]|nr:four helix bundle protein [candidate division WOR-3 bacterium]